VDGASRGGTGDQMLRVEEKVDPWRGWSSGEPGARILVKDGRKKQVNERELKG